MKTANSVIAKESNKMYWGGEKKSKNSKFVGHKKEVACLWEAYGSGHQ